MVKQTVNRPLFNVSTCIHNVHPISHTGNNTKIVRDQHNGGAESFLHTLNHLENLRLHSNVERCSWLIGDQNFRIICDRNCNNDALSHSSGEFVRKLLGAISRLRYSDDVEQLDGACLCLAISQSLMRLQHLCNLIADSMHRIQSRERVLKDHRQKSTSY